MLGNPLERERMFANRLGKTGLCATPGLKLRSGGKGRGLARGGGRGPIGIPKAGKGFWRYI